MLEPTLVEPTGDRASDDVAGREVAERVLVRHERTASLVAQHRAFAAQRLGEQRPRHRRVVQRRGVELHELHVGDGNAGPKRHRDAISGRERRVRRDREALAGATGRDDRVLGAHLVLDTRGVEHSHADRSTVLDEQIASKPTLTHFGRRLAHRSHQRALDLRAGGVTPGVDDAGDRVAALSRQREDIVVTGRTRPPSR